MDVLTLTLVFLGGLIAVLLIVFIFLGVFKKPQLPAIQEYERVAYLLSPAEHDFFQVLLQSVGPDQYVFAKVRIGDLVRVNGLVTESKDWWKKFGPIAKKHVDFVVATRSPVQPLIVLELDDSSHYTAKAKTRDSLVDRVMHAAGLPLLHIPYNSHGYTRSDLARQISQALLERGSPQKSGQKTVSQHAPA